MSEEIVLSAAQVSCLNKIASIGNVPAGELDKRSIKALEARGLAKIKESKKGSFVSLTAKGKKAALATSDASQTS